MGQAIDHSQSFVTQPFSSLQPLHIQPLQIDLQAAAIYKHCYLQAAAIYKHCYLQAAAIYKQLPNTH
jgi:hypothetical protein